MTRNHRSLRHDEAGISLAELLVTIALLSVVTGLVITMFVSFSSTTRVDRAASSNTSAAMIAMNEVTRIVRSAAAVDDASGTTQPAIMEAKRDSLMVLAYIDTTTDDPRPVRVEFSINPAGELIERRWSTTPVSSRAGAFDIGNLAAPPESQRVVVREIERDRADARDIFRYVDSADLTYPLGANQELSNAQMTAVAAVQVRFTVQTDPTEQAKPATMQNLVGIPNLNMTRLDTSP
jgi:type II secretory pathway pseudopilin PulG